MTRRYYAVLAKVSLSYPPLQGRLVTCYSPVRHCTHGLLHFLVRLACVRHAASVDSEPGSNSRLKPDVSPPRRRSEMVRRHLHVMSEDMHDRCSYLVRMIKPNLIPSHDWHVQPICQRSFRLVRLSGAVWIEARLSTGVLELVCAFGCTSKCTWPFLREHFKNIELWSRCQGLFSLRPRFEPGGGSRCAKYQRSTSTKCPSR